MGVSLELVSIAEDYNSKREKKRDHTGKISGGLKNNKDDGQKRKKKVTTSINKHYHI